MSYRAFRSSGKFGSGNRKANLMSRTMTLRSRCSSCDRAVELGFTPWAGAGPATAAEWECPECRASNHLPAIGEVSWVDIRAEKSPRADRSTPVRTH